MTGDVGREEKVATHVTPSLREIIEIILQICSLERDGDERIHVDPHILTLVSCSRAWASEMSLLSSRLLRSAAAGTELEYRDDRPVLSHMSLISMPSRRIFMDLGEIRRIYSGRRARAIRSLGMGEIVVVRTKKKEHEWLDAREALLLGIPGEMICRDGDTPIPSLITYHTTQYTLGNDRSVYQL
ncbi:hypothetical protein F5141DRAFT_1201458 [Pisolithus sp. B1]|nr:hypothetical protein F5141DRAFT_1201458 [Pisolithus sp. B1]